VAEAAELEADHVPGAPLLLALTRVVGPRLVVESPELVVWIVAVAEPWLE
jgi:hypothetical protein